MAATREEKRKRPLPAAALLLKPTWIHTFSSVLFWGFWFGRASNPFATFFSLRNTALRARFRPESNLTMRDAPKSSWRSYALALALPPMATALLPPIPTATTRPHGRLLPEGPQPTASFDDNEFHAAVRRQASDSQPASISLSTSFGPASLCGWIDGNAGK